MADFPSKVTTETSSPNSQTPQQEGNRIDTSFIRSIPAILMLAEIVLGLLQWVLIASAPYQVLPAYGWVMFVAIIFWILTIVLFSLILFGVQRNISTISWPLMVMVYHIVAVVLYLTAFLANAASVHPFSNTYFFGHMAAAAFFGAVVTVAYGASAFFSYVDWKGDGGNAASNTVPT